MPRSIFTSWRTLAVGLASALSLSTTAGAQATWVVDAAGGPGSQYTTLSAGVAAAQDGDRLIVRAGVYQPTTIAKALRIVGEPGAELRSRALADTLRIESIPAGRELTLTGFRFTDETFFNRPQLGLVVENCAGLVRLESLLFFDGWQHFALAIRNCASVHLNQCGARPGISIESSRVVLTECFAHGRAGLSGAIAQGLSSYLSHVELVHCDVKGSDGGGHAPAYQGVRADSSTLVVRGDASTRITGGLYGLSYAPAIDDPFTHQSRLELDPAVTLTGAVQGFAQQTLRALPALRASGGALGAQLRIALRSGAGDPYLVLGALPASSLPLPGLGVFELDTATLFVVASGAQAAIGSSVFVRAVPLQPELQGYSLSYQALSAPTAGLELSNAASVVLR
ncbi:MAG: hypothetical protein JNM84_23585 [Planctomycetes bacterium]|nr:hypothetical protein [Planctomycetota bacterium]